MPNILDLIKGEGTLFPTLLSAINVFTSSTEVLAALKSVTGITNPNVLPAIADYVSQYTIPAIQYAKNLNLNSLPNISRLPYSLTTQLRNFAYNITLTGFDPNTGSLTDKYITVSSSSLLTKQQALDLAVARADIEGDRYALEGSSGTVTNIFQNSAGLI